MDAFPREPYIIRGGSKLDDRGVLSYVNDFDFAGVVRFYLIENHAPGFIRAWHGHRREAKFVFVVSGTAMICAAPLEAFEKYEGGDFKQAGIFRRVLSGHRPAIMYIPPGYANGAMAIKPDTKIMHFSTLRMGEDPGDDVRFPAEIFKEVWLVKSR